MIDQDHTRVIHNSEAWFRDAELKKLCVNEQFILWNIYADVFFYAQMTVVSTSVKKAEFSDSTGRSQALRPWMHIIT